MQALPAVTSGRDFLGIAPTGSGKTAAYLLPLLMRLQAPRRAVRVPASPHSRARNGTTLQRDHAGARPRDRAATQPHYHAATQSRCHTTT